MAGSWSLEVPKVLCWFVGEFLLPQSVLCSVSDFRPPLSFHTLIISGFGCFFFVFNLQFLMFSIRELFQVPSTPEQSGVHGHIIPENSSLQLR